MAKKEKKTTGKGEVVIYQSPQGETELEVSLQEDTVWLNVNQMCMLFKSDKSVISRHISNIYKEKELKKNSTVAKFATIQ